MGVRVCVGRGEGWREEEEKPGKMLRINESEKGYIGHYNTILSFFSCSFENLEAKTKRMVHIKFRVFVLGRKVDRMTESTWAVHVVGTVLILMWVLGPWCSW